jgi:hypothetical protein
MIETKLLEIRDSCTFIPALAMRVLAERTGPGRLLWRAGYSHEHPHILLMRLEDGETQNDPYKWSLQRGRTMRAAHEWIQFHYDDIGPGDVIDVEFILGEKPTKKESELGR